MNTITIFNKNIFITKITSNTGDLAYIGYTSRKPTGAKLRAMKKTARPHIRNN